MSPETILDIVRTLLDVVLEFVPAPKAAELLDEAARKRANAIADAAEAAKFNLLPELDDPAHEDPTNPGGQ